MCSLLSNRLKIDPSIFWTCFVPFRVTGLPEPSLVTPGRRHSIPRTGRQSVAAPWSHTHTLQGMIHSNQIPHLWKEAEVPWENPRVHVENMQTSHIKVPHWWFLRIELAHIGSISLPFKFCKASYAAQQPPTPFCYVLIPANAKSVADALKRRFKTITLYLKTIIIGYRLIHMDHHREGENNMSNLSNCILKELHLSFSSHNNSSIIKDKLCFCKKKKFWNFQRYHNRV